MPADFWYCTALEADEVQYVFLPHFPVHFHAIITKQKHHTAEQHCGCGKFGLWQVHDKNLADIEA
jgi:hypothetical protein